jgi:phytoene desaturase
VPLDPAYRAHFADGSTIDVRTDADAMEAEIRRVCGPDSATGYRALREWLGA